MTLIESWDQQLFFLINNGMTNGFLDRFFLDVSELGEWMVGVMALIFLSCRGRRLMWRHIVVLLLALVLCAPVGSAVKHVVDRERPEIHFRGEVAKGEVKVRLLEAKRGKSQSFPSGHSMLAFYFMTYVGLVNRSQRLWALLIAFLIAFARVYVGVHFPGDCIAGGLMGAAGGWIAWLAFRRLGKALDPPVAAEVVGPGTTGPGGAG